MLNEIYGITGHSGVIGAALGLIWILGLAAATFGWMTMPKDSHRS